MEKSESIKTLASALAAFQAEVGNVPKEATNPFYKSKYATLEAVIETAKPVLAKHGLSFAQFPQERGLYTLVMHTSGEYLGSWSALVIKDETPQGQGSAITYLRRYALSAILGLATEDDDDGNAATQSKPAAKPVPPKVAAQSKEGKKKAIADLLKAKVAADPTNLNDEPATKEDYEEECMRYTELPLVDENYDAILRALIK